MELALVGVIFKAKIATKTKAPRLIIHESGAFFNACLNTILARVCPKSEHKTLNGLKMAKSLPNCVK